MSTETTTTSYGSRVGSAFKGILVGFVLVIAAIALLFWNEGRTIKRAKALDEAGSNVVSVDPATLDVANEDKLIHIAGDVVTDEVLTDAEFGVSLNALSLTRKVETYQWQEETKTETRRTSGGGEEKITTYSYQKVWSENLIDSSSFHDAGHDNPQSVAYYSQEFLSPTATIGAFSLTAGQISSLNPSVEYNVANIPVAEPAAAEAPAAAPAAYTPAMISESFAQEVSTTAAPADDLVISVDAPAAPAASAATPAPAAAPATIVVDGTVAPAAAEAAKFEIVGAGYYVGNPKEPKIGDQKITFSYVATPCPTSFIGQQHGDSLIDYQAKTGSVFLQAAGIKTSEEMITSAKNGNRMIAWLLRLAGFVILYIALKMLFAPLEVMADILPFASKIVGFGTGLIAGCLTLCIGLISIAVGWLYYRPIIGGALIAVAVVALLYPFIRGKKKNQAA